MERYNGGAGAKALYDAAVTANFAKYSLTPGSLLTGAYAYPTGTFDQKLEAMKFDFNKPLENILEFESVDDLATNYTCAQLLSNAFVPKQPNNPGYDWLLFFELKPTPKQLNAPTGKLNKNILVVAIENKYTLLGNSTAINFKKDVAKKHKNTHTQLLPVTEEKNIVFVVMARRHYAPGNTLPKNTFVLSQDEYDKLVGPTILYLLKTVESMNPRSPSASSTSSSTSTSSTSSSSSTSTSSTSSSTLSSTTASTTPTKPSGKRGRDSDDEDDQPQKKKQKTGPCAHKCKDKATCAHNCCKRV